MSPYFDIATIRSGLIDCSDEAAPKCYRQFHKLLKVRKQGLEKIFDQTFQKSIEDIEGWRVKTQERRKDYAGPNDKRGDGRIDVVAYHKEGDYRLGIEFKVCEFPRSKNNDGLGVTYDIGQIAWDFGALKGYQKLDSAYCIIVLYGGIPTIPKITAKAVERLFHNAMYADFQHALKWGIYNKHLKEGVKRKQNPWFEQGRKFQVDTIKKMGMSEPYRKGSASKLNFSRLYPKEKIAVLGIHVR